MTASTDCTQYHRHSALTQSVGQRPTRPAVIRISTSWFPMVSALLMAINVAGGHDVILDTDFVAAEGYYNGQLQFQSIQNGTEGTWLGHLGAIVDTTDTGTVTRSGDPRRNLFHKGATGGFAGGSGSGETIGNGFEIGDLLTISHVYSFVVDASPSVGLLQSGVRPNYANGESVPEVGIKVDYSNAGSGLLKVYSNLDRSSVVSADDPFALIVNAADIGIGNGFSGELLDFASDKLRFTWIAEYTAIDTWQTREISIENLSTGFSSRASIDNPTALEEVLFADSGTEAFFGMQQLQGFLGSGVTDSVYYTYVPNGGEVPGDFDRDRDVDGSDLLNWQQNARAYTDLLIWQSRYGTSIASPIESLEVIPESDTLLLCGMAISLNCVWRCRSVRRQID